MKDSRFEKILTEFFVIGICVIAIFAVLLFFASKNIGNEQHEIAVYSSNNLDIYGKGDEEMLQIIREMDAGEIIDTSDFSDDLIDSLFFKESIGEEVASRIVGNSYRENENITLDDLNYIRVLHIGFDGKTHVGEIIVNKAIADDVIEIFRELYKNNYQIEKMLLIDEYNTNDELSMADNNSSGFAYRNVADTTELSLHALGMAIDINPLYNPYVTYESDGSEKISPENAYIYADRSADFPHKIDETDICYQIFINHGFKWGGSWQHAIDYQHFYKE